MPKHTAIPGWQRSLVVLTATTIGVVVVTSLYWAQVVFIPVAMAVFLTFLLTPLVRGIERRGVRRTPSVLIVAAGTILISAATLGVVARQLSALATDFPKYSKNITSKITAVKKWSATSSGLAGLIEDISNALGAVAAPGGSGRANTDPSQSANTPTEVVLQPRAPAWLVGFPKYLGTAAESLGSLALAFVLVIFMLLNREDLRARFLRLVGQKRLSSTTKAIDDAGDRVSQYLLMQAIVNASYGLALALGLFAIGVDYAVLWGFLAAVLRYVPYLGAWIASAFPILLSLAMFPGWWPPLAVLALVLVLELVSNNFIEPWLYGQSLGISAVAQLVSAAFWSFLWGPIGLILSAPLTAVLLVLGKNVPQLEFLEVLLGDEPALSPDALYYQRLLARDQDEASQLVLAEVKLTGLDAVFDEVLIPTLCNAKRDHAREHLSDSDLEFVLQSTAEILEDLGTALPADSVASPVQDGSVHSDVASQCVRLLACPARDEADRLGLVMLKQKLDPQVWHVEITAVETLTAELVARVEDEQRAIVCVGSLPPGGLAHTRYLCKRLRAKLPGLKIVVGHWGSRAAVASNDDPLREAGADLIAVTLRDTCSQLEDLRSELVIGERLASVQTSPNVDRV
ncbi:hypothetical protein AYO47_07540 [Planctomyces sp. SCGC AG-212-M04]|nr:hypothetical protein AYO47_07540 [Planctomyces sp. SCGC AG-212-M04]